MSAIGLDPPLCEADRRSRVGGRLLRNHFSRDAGSVQDTQHFRGTGGDRSGSGSHPRSADCESLAWAERALTFWTLLPKRP